MKFVTPENTNTTVASASVDKKDIIGDLVVVSLTSFQPDLETSYGTTTASFLTLTVVTGSHAGQRFEEWAAFGVLGAQIGQVGEGNHGLGRITTGESGQGRKFFGFAFSSDPADITAAEKVMAEVETPAPVAAPF
jgi:hypothetical protein